MHRWQQITEDKRENFPLLRYTAESCVHPEHEEKHGLLYPANHTFWEVWYPPNSCPCYCFADSISDKEIEKGRAQYGKEAYRFDVDTSSFKFPHPDEGFGVNWGKLQIEDYFPVTEENKASVTQDLGFQLTCKKLAQFFTRVFGRISR